MKTVVVVSEPENRRATLSVPVANAFVWFFRKLGWQVRETTKRIANEPDLIAGWGFREVIHEAWDRWPDKILHVDAGYWTRHSYNKLELGGRWISATNGEYPEDRLRQHHVRAIEKRRPGKTILVCGMSAKAAHSIGLMPEQWECEAISKLRDAGAKCIYRPKPTWPDARPIAGASFDQRACIGQTLMGDINGVVSHHSNGTLDALAAGLPIYVETGIAKPLSVESLEDVVGAVAHSIVERTRFFRQVAWHQWTLDELARGVWLKPPAPLAGLLS